jgi:hypothetical protein
MLIISMLIFHPHRNLQNIPQFNKEKPKDVNMYSNWLTIGNIRISTEYAQNPPRTLLRSQLMSHL